MIYECENIWRDSKLLQINCPPSSSLLSTTAADIPESSSVTACRPSRGLFSPTFFDKGLLFGCLLPATSTLKYSQVVQLSHHICHFFFLADGLVVMRLSLHPQ